MFEQKRDDKLLDEDVIRNLIVGTPNQGGYPNKNPLLPPIGKRPLHQRKETSISSLSHLQPDKSWQRQSKPVKSRSPVTHNQSWSVQNANKTNQSIKTQLHTQNAWRNNPYKVKSTLPRNLSHGNLTHNATGPFKGSRSPSPHNEVFPDETNK